MTAPFPLCYRVRTAPVGLERLPNTHKSNRFTNNFPRPPPRSFLPLERPRLSITSHLTSPMLYRRNSPNAHSAVLNRVWREPLRKWKRR